MSFAAQLGASLLAILVLAWLAAKLGLGGDERIRDEDHARELAHHVHYGFEPIEVAIDRAGMGALLKDSEGRQLLIRRHGSHFAGRMLDANAHARLDRSFLTIGAEKSFGQFTLDLGDQAQSWAAGLRGLRG